MVDRDVAFAKIGIIKRCMQRIVQVTALNPDTLDDINVQDVFVLNLQRAAQAAIDLAAHVVASEGFGMPVDLKENFRFLKEHDIIDADLAEKFENMVGFRNIAVHEYQEIDIAVLKTILIRNLRDFEDFYAAVVVFFRLDQG
jgi:uncharacterized protein YutE (UPF0331/DUF86 family)